MATIPARQFHRRRTLAQWASENPTLAKGEIGLAYPATGTDPPGVKIGDGTSAWNSLSWADMRAGLSISSSEMTTTASRISTNRVPRIVLPATGTTSVIIGPKGFPTWWFTRGFVMGFDWTNDHSATGNVRFRFTLQGNPIGGSVASPNIDHTETITVGSPSANGGITTSLVNSGNAIVPAPGAFGVLFTFEFERLGDDAADTLAGNAGLCEFVFLAAK